MRASLHLAARLGWLSVLLVLAAAASGEASDVPVAGDRLVGPPESRPPLRGSLTGAPPALAATVRRAVDDWNQVATEAFGAPVFAWSEQEEGAAVALQLEAEAPDRLFGVTWLDADEQGVLRLPVRITLS